MRKPKVFIGSSTGYLPVAEALKWNLADDVSAKVWNEGIFSLTYSTLESLLRALEQFDFAVFVFAPDDPVTLRKVTTAATRDNVLFEFGLFMGRLGRDKCFFVKPSNVDLRVATDLMGITYADYTLPRRGKKKLSQRDLRPLLREAAKGIRNHLRKSLRGERGLLEEVAGDWIELKEFANEDRPYTFLNFCNDQGVVRVTGQSYGADGTPGVKFPHDQIDFAVIRNREILHAYSAEHQENQTLSRAYGISRFNFSPTDPCTKGDGYYASYSDGAALRSHKAAFRLRKQTRDYISCFLGKKRIDNEQDRKSLILQLEAFRTPMVVITGGPYAGKTEVIKSIAAKGYDTLEESALLVINEQRLKWKDRYAKWRDSHYLEFQTQIFRCQRTLEMARRRSEKPLFLDRSAVDIIAYLELRGERLKELKVPKEIEIYAEEVKFHKVFVLDTLPNYDERRHTGRDSDFAQSLRIRDKLVEVYRRYGNDVEFLKVDSIPNRVDQILEAICGPSPRSPGG